MKLVLYIYRLFFPLFIASMITFSFVIELVDLMMNIWRYIQNSVPASVVGTIMLNFLPKSLAWSLPLSVLFASCFLLSVLYSKNELTALFASGVSLLRFTAPILILSAVLSFALFIFQDKVVVKANLKYDETKSAALKQTKTIVSNNVMILSEGGRVVYKAENYDDEAKRLRALYVVMRGEQNELISIVSADYALWNVDHWSTQNGWEYKYQDDTLKCVPISRQTELALTEPPETFKNSPISVDAATIEESRAYIAHLRKTGLPFAEALSKYYNKFSFPFVVFIVAFLSVGISAKGRRNVFVISLTLSLGAAVLFYVTQMITMLMAKFSMLPPLAGAWFPVVLFVFLSAVLLKYSHT